MASAYSTYMSSAFSKGPGFSHQSIRGTSYGYLLQSKEELHTASQDPYHYLCLPSLQTQVQPFWCKAFKIRQESHVSCLFLIPGGIGVCLCVFFKSENKEMQDLRSSQSSEIIQDYQKYNHTFCTVKIDPLPIIPVFYARKAFRFFLDMKIISKDISLFPQPQ